MKYQYSPNNTWELEQCIADIEYRRLNYTDTVVFRVPDEFIPELHKRIWAQEWPCSMAYRLSGRFSMTVVLYEAFEREGVA